MTKGTYSAGTAASGRDLRAMLRTARWWLRTGGRLAAPRVPAANERDVERRAVGRRVRVALEVRSGTRLGIWVRELNTAADRIAVCSLEKKLSRRP
jgi:hypothetical protein